MSTAAPAGSICYTQMRRKSAKKSIEPTNEAMRRVIGPARTRACQNKTDQRINAYRVQIVLLKNVELLRLGHRIREARKVLGYSLRDFSAKCGLERSCLGGVERGERNVTFNLLCTICTGLNCDLAALTLGIPHLASKKRDCS